MTALSAHELSIRLRLLLDAIRRRDGEKLTYDDIAQRLEEAGVRLTRSRWFYMQQGRGHQVSDPGLLSALADVVFDVPSGYLLEESAGVPDAVRAQLDFVRALRLREVQSFATRTLEGLAPHELDALTRLVESALDEPPEAEHR